MKVIWGTREEVARRGRDNERPNLYAVHNGPDALNVMSPVMQTALDLVLVEHPDAVVHDISLCCIVTGRPNFRLSYPGQNTVDWYDWDETSERWVLW